MDTFILDKKQLEKLNKWKESIKKKHREYGLYDYIFTPTGIGVSVKVKSHLTNEILCLTEVNKW